MTMLRRMAVGVALLFLAAGCTLGARADAPCDDLLAALNKKPAALEFQGCKPRTDLQGQPSEASYRVRGAQAAGVEESLTKELRIKRLQRTCCLWESTRNSYRDRRGRLFVISMATEETTIDSRSEWAKIPYFYVTVDLYRDDP
jgi:hypothetical protein